MKALGGSHVRGAPRRSARVGLTKKPFLEFLVARARQTAGHDFAAREPGRDRPARDDGHQSRFDQLDERVGQRHRCDVRHRRALRGDELAQAFDVAARRSPGRQTTSSGAANAARGLDFAVAWSKPFATMRILPSNVVAAFLALAVSAGVTSAFASSFDHAPSAQPQCGGDDKKESKGGDKKDDKSSDTKPKPTPQG